jgi:hypothetical protein
LKPTIWIFGIEPLDTRYTAQWHKYLPKMLESELGGKYRVVQVDGIQKNSTPTDGAFLNFSDTNYWKSSQLCNFLEHHNKGETSSNDQILYTDAWNPTVIQIKYMKELLGYKWKLHGLFHAGSYDPHDFLGRLIGNQPWVRHVEKSFFFAFDHNYFATKFHIELFMQNLLNDGLISENPWFEEDLEEALLGKMDEIVRTGWPMEYMNDELDPYKNLTKRNLILFPHRIAAEKQVEIFRDLAKQMPEYEFVVCQDQELSKQQYHTLLGQSKIVFSCSLQETLGIGCYEGSILGAAPLVPDRLSYTEMYDQAFKYPSEWTIDWNKYMENQELLVDRIRTMMNQFENNRSLIAQQAQNLTESFFTAKALLEKMNIEQQNFDS